MVRGSEPSLTVGGEGSVCAPADWEASYRDVRKTCALPAGSKEEKEIRLPAGAELRREALGMRAAACTALLGAASAVSWLGGQPD